MAGDDKNDYGNRDLDKKSNSWLDIAKAHLDKNNERRWEINKEIQKRKDEGTWDRDRSDGQER